MKPISHLKFWADLLERSVASFIAGFAGSYIAAGAVGSVQDLPVTARLSIGASAGLFSVMKALAAVQLPWTAENSASTLPEKLDPPAPEPPKLAVAKRKPRKPVVRDDGLTLVEALVVVLVVAVVLIIVGRL